MAISFDLFGTLIEADRPTEPSTAVKDGLKSSGVSVPSDWKDAYWEHHLSKPEGAEISLKEHVQAALESRGVQAEESQVDQALQEAFDPKVYTRPNARDIVRWANRQGPVAVCSNCTIPGLVDRSIRRSDISIDVFDVVISSSEFGWRKPHPKIFHKVADELSVEPSELIHVGDTPDADGGIEDVGGTAILLTEYNIKEVPEVLND
ncbi:HAD family hydrolase [Salinarchaeum sp. IM2453]|uniref:HAD family hydrolase n=1 Tax=Salinarchaeum sp. IM2453 TaxID=2862870 RepID=UPI001C836444|nr:HAD family hydrolase [Salinarchaeum sp. IM2453]QZA87467.1 HAD family hydrolase [Salinarchaeum sp. IM2453]